MSKETDGWRLDVLKAIASTGDDDDWQFNGDTATYDGEHCDGDPSWTITDMGGYLDVEWECGWYQQRAEANWDDLEVVAEALKAAHEAMNGAFNEARRREHEAYEAERRRQAGEAMTQLLSDRTSAPTSAPTNDQGATQDG